jgi:Tfp pilus assembly protein PilF
MSPMSTSENTARTTLKISSCCAVPLLLLLCWAPVLWAQDCVAPESMRARLENHPTADDFTDLGVYFAKNEQYACAVPAFAASLNLTRDAPDVALMFGASLLMSGNAEDAVPPLQVAEQAEPYNIKVHLLLASAFEQLNQVSNADEEWRAALRIDPASSSALDHLSTRLVAAHDYAGAITLLGNPLISGERTATQSLNLGLSYAATGNLNEAVIVLRDGLNTSPDSLPMANALADVLLSLTRPDEAITVLDLAMAQHPEDLDTQLHYRRIVSCCASARK